MKRSGGGRRVKVSADGRGVVSHAGTALLRELAVETGLAGEVTATLIDTYRGLPVHAPGQVFADLAVAIADGADCVSHIEVFGDQHEVCGPVASMPTTWRLLDRIDPAHLPDVACHLMSPLVPMTAADHGSVIERPARSGSRARP